MTELSESDINNAMRQLQEKARKYDYLMDKYQEQAKELDEITEKLEEASEMIAVLRDKFAPRVGGGIAKSRMPKGKNAAVLQEIVEKMGNGLEVGMDFLEKAYPDLSEKEHRYLFVKIAKLPNLDKRRDKATNKVLYFMRNA